MSFPSGHASAAFAGFGFLALYLNAKLNIFPRTTQANLPQSPEEKGTAAPAPPTRAGARRTPHFKLLLWMLPWLVALLIAASKVRDGWHHPVDVLFGALVGTLCAHMAFWCVFRGVYDGRVNHLPRG